jgi:hypothetical protein
MPPGERRKWEDPMGLKPIGRRRAFALGAAALTLWTGRPRRFGKQAPPSLSA